MRRTTLALRAPQRCGDVVDIHAAEVEARRVTTRTSRQGGIHGFRNEDGPASMLLLFSPGAAREDYFERLPTLRRQQPRKRAAFFDRHDNVWL